MSKKDVMTKLNPSLALTFLVVSVTGMMMLFHFGGWGAKQLHQWMSVVFLILAIVHLSMNWKSLRAYFKHGPIALSLIGVSLLSVLLLFGAGDKDGRSPDGHSGAEHAGYPDSGHGEWGRRAK